MTRPARPPLRERLTHSPLGANHAPESDPATITRQASPGTSLEPTRVQPRPARLRPAQAVREGISADQVWAESVALSGMLSKDFHDNVANIMWAIGYARSLNISVMAVLNGIYINKGKPTMTTQMMAALVIRSGHKVRPYYSDEPMAAWVEVVRADDPDHPRRFPRWDLNRAARAGLITTYEGRPVARSEFNNPLPWELYTHSMLMRRAEAEALRGSCQDVLMGVIYTPEEMGMNVDADGKPVGEREVGTINLDNLDGLGAFEEPGEWVGVDDDPPTPEPEEGSAEFDPWSFQPAAATLEEWEQAVADGVRRGDRQALNNLHQLAAQNHPDSTDLATLFERARQQMHNHVA